MTKIAIIGTGMSAATLACLLNSHADITLFEKARGVGGRMSTRRANGYQFDHGAQYFVAKTDEFQQFLIPWVKAGIVAPWLGKFVEISNHQKTSVRDWQKDFPHYVAVPQMNALVKALVVNSTILLNKPVPRLCKDHRWMVEIEGGTDWAV